MFLNIIYISNKVLPFHWVGIYTLKVTIPMSIWNNHISWSGTRWHTQKEGHQSTKKPGLVARPNPSVTPCSAPRACWSARIWAFVAWAKQGSRFHLIKYECLETQTSKAASKLLGSWLMAVLPWAAWDLISSTPLSKVAQGRIPVWKSIFPFEPVRKKVLESSMQI